MKNSFIIKLINLRFFSKIGLFESERIIGNNFIVNARIEIDASSFNSEDLSTTISYADIYSVIDEVMTSEWLLLETVAITIKDKLTSRWTQIKGGKIEIIKETPPIPGIDGSCGIEYIF